MLELVKAAKSAKGQIGAGLAGAMDRVVSDLQDAYAVADSRTARVTADLVAQAEAVKGRRRPAAGMRAERAPVGRPAGVSTPLPVTRGVGTGKTLRKGAGRGRV
jgi:hypothetical protein